MKSPWIIDVTDENFEVEVLERSQTATVVVDFWAEWCGPCRMLGPILEKLAVEFDGNFILAKADTEKAPKAAGQFGVQSIPAVYGLRDGQVVDGFMGALPEEQIRQWLQKLMPSMAESLVAEAQSLADQDPTAAEARLLDAIEQDPNLIAARTLLGRLMLNQNRKEECQSMIDELAKRGFLEPELEALQSELQLVSGDASKVQACRDTLSASPDDLSLQIKLAEALAANGEYEEALQLSLQVVQTDKANFGEPARKLMVDIFRVLPDDSELTGTYRRKLSSALF